MGDEEGVPKLSSAGVEVLMSLVDVTYNDIKAVLC